MMKGVGGPLLCIGDLLSDVGESDASSPPQQPEPSVSVPSFTSTQNPDLSKLFQENYDQLNEALAGTDHSWAGLTLKLCGALETANKLAQTTNSNVTLLSEKVGDLERVIKRADSAIAAARVVHTSLTEKEGSLTVNRVSTELHSHPEQIRMLTQIPRSWGANPEGSSAEADGHCFPARVPA